MKKIDLKNKKKRRIFELKEEKKKIKKGREESEKWRI